MATYNPDIRGCCYYNDTDTNNFLYILCIDIISSCPDPRIQSILGSSTPGSTPKITMDCPNIEFTSASAPASFRSYYFHIEKQANVTQKVPVFFEIHGLNGSKKTGTVTSSVPINIHFDKRKKKHHRE